MRPSPPLPSCRLFNGPPPIDALTDASWWRSLIKRKSAQPALHTMGATDEDEYQRTLHMMQQLHPRSASIPGLGSLGSGSGGQASGLWDALPPHSTAAGSVPQGVPSPGQHVHVHAYHGHEHHAVAAPAAARAGSDSDDWADSLDEDAAGRGEGVDDFTRATRQIGLAVSA